MNAFKPNSPKKSSYRKPLSEVTFSNGFRISFCGGGGSYDLRPKRSVFSVSKIILSVTVSLILLLENL